MCVYVENYGLETSFIKFLKNVTQRFKIVFYDKVEEKECDMTKMRKRKQSTPLNQRSNYDIGRMTFVELRNLPMQDLKAFIVFESDLDDVDDDAPRLLLLSAPIVA